MHDADLARSYFRTLKENELILPSLNHKVLYQILEYTPLLDSSNMSCQEWISIAKDIEKNYNAFDGFVILHGTDTLAYTSSVLSFMLEGLQKPVIVTGSQIPIYETGSDAKGNFLSALIFAGCYNIPEVCVMFANKLFRGNRTTKISPNLLQAFDSPNYHALAIVDTDVTIYHQYVRKCDRSLPFRVQRNLNPNVGMVFFFPTITSSMLQSFLSPPIEGVIIQTYGAGNIPSNRTDLIETLRAAVNRKVVVINITQCAKGNISTDYETGKVLEDNGIISGHDMTAEAALAKLTNVLGVPGLSYESRVEIMKADLRGELTDGNNKNNDNYY